MMTTPMVDNTILAYTLSLGVGTESSTRLVLRSTEQTTTTKKTDKLGNNNRARKKKHNNKNTLNLKSKVH